MSWRTPITLLVLLGVLLGAAFYGWHTIISPVTGDDPEPLAHQPRCADVETFHKGDQIKSRDVIVNVYNAGAISGLATDTLAVLANRGFQLGVADNAPPGASATNVTIMTDNRTAPQIRLVAQQFKGTVKYAKERRRGTGVSIVVGDEFVGIDQKALHSLLITKPVRVCIKASAAS